MNDFEMKCRLRTAGAMAFAAFALAFAAHAGEQVKSRMFDLTFASAVEVAENFNRTWCGRIMTNGCPFVGAMAVPFIEANSVMVTAPAAILEACEKVIKDIIGQMA